MAGQRAVTKLGQSLFQSGVLYKPGSIARRIVNLRRTPEGTLETLPGCGRLEPKVTTGAGGGNFNGPVLGLAHVETFAGANQVTIIRAGTELVRHQGWDRTFTALKTGLTYDGGQKYPDVCLPINGFVVWSNGIDRPLMVDCRTDGRLVTPLGFDTAPAAPTAMGPSQGGFNASALGIGSALAGVGSGPYAPNTLGYSVPGNIGTVSQFNGEDGALLESAHQYAAQFEDIFGNLSPLSPLSNTVSIAPQSCGYTAPASGTYVRKNKLDLLLRGFAVKMADVGELHVAAMRLYRTTDTLHSDGELHLRARVDGRMPFTYPDGLSDGALLAGDVPIRPWGVRAFKVACEYQGRLIIGNIAGAPGMVRWSQPGTIGTFDEDDWAVPDAGGGEVKGLCSFAGAVYILTDSSVFRLDLDAEGRRLVPISQTDGTVAPASVQVLPDGRLVWLSRNSFMAYDGNTVTDIGLPVQVQVARINVSMAGRTAAAIDPETGVYLCAVPIDAANNTTVLAYDVRTGGWSEYDFDGARINVMHAATGRAGYLFCGVTNSSGTSYTLNVWGYPDVNGAYLTALASSYETTTMRVDDLGLVPFRVREILIGFIESDSTANDPSLTVRVYPTARTTFGTPTARTIDTNGEVSRGSYTDYPAELVAQDFVDTWRLGNVTLNATEAYYRTPIVTWRRVLVDVGTTNGFAFKLIVASGRRINLYGFAMIAQTEGEEASRVPGPTRTVED